MLASSPRKLPKLSTSISVAVFVKQLVEGGRDTPDVLTEKLNYIHVNNKQMVMTVFASLKILIWLCGSMNKF